MNKYSIGIELDNPGHGSNYKGFLKSQMNSLMILLKNILNKYNISYKNVLAHSDIAPERKADPGELFNWDYLSKKTSFLSSNKKRKQRIFFFNLETQDTKIIYIKKLLE